MGATAEERAHDEAALTPDVVRAYAEGRLAWSRIREDLGVRDFGALLRRLGEEGLRLPRVPRDRPSAGKAWVAEWLRDRAG